MKQLFLRQRHVRRIWRAIRLAPPQAHGDETQNRRPADGGQKVQDEQDQKPRRVGDEGNPKVEEQNVATTPSLPPTPEKSTPIASSLNEVCVRACDVSALPDLSNPYAHSFRFARARVSATPVVAGAGMGEWVRAPRLCPGSAPDV